MDEKVIKELIEQLTENLEKVESARQQVEKTVKAYDALKKDVEKYTKELGFIVQNVRTIISQLEEIKDKFIGKISTEIIDEIKHATSLLSKLINEVTNKVTLLEELINNKSAEINDNIKQRHDTIDTTLSSIKTLINDADAKVVSCLKQVAQAVLSIQLLSQSEQKHYNTIYEQLNRLNMVQKQNKFLSIVIIVLLLTIIGLICFKGGM